MTEEVFYRDYVSNTIAGCANQSYFDQPEEKTSVIFLRVQKHGRREYAFLFSGRVDSTYNAGERSACDDPCGPWEIRECKAAAVKRVPESISEIGGFRDLLFDGKKEKTVGEGESFFSDPISLTVGRGKYLCLLITYRGKRVPCHLENVIPTFDLSDGKLLPQKELPLPSMVGCKRKAKTTVAFFGDSITQGIGCREDSYLHYTAVCAKILGKKYAFWNLGIGYGRASDAAHDGSWAAKAKHAQIAVVCFGVNDILKGSSAETVTENLEKTVRLLKEKGIRVLLQTVPPFDMNEENEAKRIAVNHGIKNTLVREVDGVFDNNCFLSDANDPAHALYGGHPNEEGCAIWGRELAKVLGKML